MQYSSPFLRGPYRAGAIALLGLLWTASAWAAPPSGEKLLGADSKVFINVPNVEDLREAFNSTQLGKLLDDPVMQPFLDDLDRQLEERVSETGQRLGLQWEDFEGLAGAEASLAITMPAEDKVATVLVVDVTDGTPQAMNLVEKAGTNLVAERKAVRRTEDFGGTELIIYDVPASQTRPAGTAVYFLKDGLLGIADNIEAAQTVLQRWQGEREDGIETVEAYQKVQEQCRGDAGDQPIHASWFVRPIDAAKALRVLDPPEELPSPDPLVIAQNQGFGVVEAIGGVISLAVEERGIIHRTMIYAPGELTKGSGVLVFPTGQDFTPPDWVPRDVVSATVGHWDLKTAFEAFGFIFDEVMEAEGVFNDVIEQVKTDPNGPQIDIREDLFGHLGTRVIFLGDHKLPVTQDSKRWLLAVELTNPQAMADAVAKSMENDPTVKVRKFGEHTIYEIVGEEEAVGEALVPAGGDAPAEFEEEEITLPNSVIAVALGHVLIGSHVDTVEKILTPREERESLSADVDYQFVMAQLDKLGSENVVARRFERNDERYRVSYELFRRNELPGADTPTAALLDMLAGGLDDDDSAETAREQKIDGSKLPEFQVARRYLGPAGAVATEVENGWFIVAFTLNKDSMLTATKQN